MRRSISLVVLFVVACGSAGGGGGRPATVAKPDFDLGLVNEVFFGANSTAPAPIELSVENRATTPLILRRVELSSPGQTQYGIFPIARDFRETIQPGETKTVTIFATAQTTVRRPTEPLALRAVVELEAAGQRWRELIITR